jgi:predicted Mrr-cat superfamily restriction endonuclease
MSKDIKPEDLKTELINDLIATTTVMEEIWNYHPDNPNKKDVVKEFNVLKQIKKDIEKEIAEIDK